MLQITGPGSTVTSTSPVIGSTCFRPPEVTNYSEYYTRCISTTSYTTVVITYPVGT